MNRDANRSIPRTGLPLAMAMEHTFLESENHRRQHTDALRGAKRKDGAMPARRSSAASGKRKRQQDAQDEWAGPRHDGRDGSGGGSKRGRGRGRGRGRAAPAATAAPAAAPAAPAAAVAAAVVAVAPAPAAPAEAGYGVYDGRFGAALDCPATPAGGLVELVLGTAVAAWFPDGGWCRGCVLRRLTRKDGFAFRVQWEDGSLASIVPAEDSYGDDGSWLLVADPS